MNHLSLLVFIGVILVPFGVLGVAISRSVRQSIRAARFTKANPPRDLPDYKVEALARHLCEVDSVDPHANYGETKSPGWMHYVPNARHYVAAFDLLMKLEQKEPEVTELQAVSSAKALVTGIKRIKKPKMPTPPPPPTRTRI
jgi:hypothetical protein